MARALRLLGVVLLAVALLAGLAGWQALRLYRAPGPLAAPAQVVVPRGGTEVIAGTLRQARGIEDARAFAVAAWVTRGAGPLRAAEFAFPPGASLEQVLGVLRGAR